MEPCTVIVATCGRIERLSRALDAIGRAIGATGGAGTVIVAAHYRRALSLAA